MQRNEIELSTPGGPMSAFFVAPSGDATLPGIVFLMDGLGYRDALFTMAERLAGEGHRVLVPDLFHHVGPKIHFDPSIFTQPEKLGEMRKRMGGLTTDMLMGDVAACLDRLGGDALGAVGFCMGGRNAFLAATRFPDRLKAAVALHPGGLVTAEPTSPHLSAASATAHLYFGVAKDDVFFTAEQATTLEATLTSLGKTFEIAHYAAKHGWAVIDTPVYDHAEAERAHGATLRVFRAAFA